MRRVLTSAAAALALAVLVPGIAAAQTVRDHRLQSDPIVRDHRQSDSCDDPGGGAEQPVVRDHRTQQTFVRDHRTKQPVVRDHRESDSCDDSAGAVAEQPIVRDHRQQPVVRDHREGTTPPVVRDHRQVTAPPVVRDHRTPGRNARFLVVGVSLHANDETGPDFAGSDEIVVQYHDRVSGRRLQTSVFGDFDTGETRAFSSSQMCITPVLAVGRPGQPWRCQTTGAAGPVRFDVKVLEVDNWSNIACAVGTASPVGNGCLSDRVGSASIAFSHERLLSELPRVGAWRNYPVRLGGYTLTYRVQRVRDAAQ